MSKSDLILRYPLGEVSDIEIAKKVGCSREYVRQVREKQGIKAPPRPPQMRNRTPEVTLAAARARAGREPDKKIAKDLGIGWQRVRKMRIQAGIDLRRIAVSDFQESIKPFLGQMSDAKLAKKFGCSWATVIRLRKKFGVAAWRQTKGQHYAHQ